MGETADNHREVIVRYHERTKHLVGRYARSLGYLDWDTQPDPFRTYDGAPRTPLESMPPPVSGEPDFDSVVSEGRIEARNLSRESITQFLFDSLAISAWKRFEDSRWSLRCNPSSGNLHPTEGYLILPRIEGFTESPGVFHYAVKPHALELRRPLPDDLFARTFPRRPEGSFFVGLSSIHWREAWKYGERAFRYCQHDVGHAIAALAYSASALGWSVRVLDQIADDRLAALLAIDDQADIESEVPDVLLLVQPAGCDVIDREIELDAASAAEHAGRPRLGARNTLSADHVPWEAIDVAEAVTRKAATPPQQRSPRVRGSDLDSTTHELLPRPHQISARTIFRQRRSAVALDGVTGITKDAFFRILAATMPEPSRVPFAAFSHEPAIHPVLFVHRVEGLSPGLYVLPRALGAEAKLRAAMRDSFRFEAVPDAPPSLPLRLLETGDVKNGASFIACQQAIAADGAFAVGMLAEFEPRLTEHGAWFYRTMHHEAGALGQTLYLEAEALGIRGTGIGCFFDDEMHSLLGLRDRTFQTIYHFTIGGPVDDPRLATE